MTRLSKFKNFALSAIAALTLSTATQGIAQSGTGTVPSKDPISLIQFLEDIGASERINMSGKLRMLSQQIPAAACNLHAGIAVEQSKTVLHAAKEKFDTIIAALEFGDENLGIIGQEGRHKTLAAIGSVHATYDPMHAAFNNIEETGGTEAEVLAMAEHNMGILLAAKVLISEISSQYTNPAALSQSDALMIDVAGRQRMLTQKISKEICFITSGIHADASIEVLGSTINMFETSLNALHFGMENAGISPAPTDEIVAGLERVQADWEEIGSLVKHIAMGGTIDDAERTVIFTGLNKTMGDMNTVVGLYVENAKLGL